MCIGVHRCTTVVRVIHPLPGILVRPCAWVCCKRGRGYTCSPRSEMPPPSCALELESLLPWDGSGDLQKKCTCMARAPRSTAPRTRGTQSWMGNSVAEASDRHGGRCSAVRARRRPPPHLPLAALCKSPTCPSSPLLPRPAPNADPPTCPRESLLGRGARPAAARGTQRRRNPRCAHDPRAARTHGLIGVALPVQMHAVVSQTTTNDTRAAARRSRAPHLHTVSLTHTIAGQGGRNAAEMDAVPT